MDDVLDLSDHRVTSEVHVFSEGTLTPDESEPNEKIVISNFKFTLPDQLRIAGSTELQKDTTTYDEDGDLVVQRKDQAEDHHLAIKHHIHTSLDLVGLQVWRGALLLADFLLDSAVDGSIGSADSVIELGAGTGLTSVVAGMVAGHVLSTDIAKGNILSLIETNVQQNASWIKGRVEVKELDFYKPFQPELVPLLENSNLIIAADVVYHDDLTDAFISTLKRIMSMGKEKTALISLEKRFVFTLNDMDVAAPCYEYFHDQLIGELTSQYDIQQLDTSKTPQYFCYERAKELVLFRIRKK